MQPGSSRLLSRLKLRHLTLLTRIKPGDSMTRVAESMGVSQPAVTKSLAEIEDLFGGPLFVRTARGLHPTPLGELAVVRARHMLQDIDHWALEMDALRGGHSAHLHVGAIPFISARVLVPTIERLYDQHRITVGLERATTDQLLQSLRAHELDCVIGRASVMIGMDELHHEVLYPQRPALIANPGLARRMARRKPDWRELADLNWILPAPATPIGNMISELFTRAGVRPPAGKNPTHFGRVVSNGKRAKAMPAAACYLPTHEHRGRTGPPTEADSTIHHQKSGTAHTPVITPAYPWHRIIKPHVSRRTG